MMKTNYILHSHRVPPIDDQLYRLKKVDEMEQFLRSEVAYRDQLTKRYKRRAAASNDKRHFSRNVSNYRLLSIASSVATLGIGRWNACKYRSSLNWVGTLSNVSNCTQNPKDFQLKG